MALHVYCQTELALILIGVQGESGQYFFFSDNPELPGLSFTVKPRLSINEQIISYFNSRFKTNLNGQDFQIEQNYCERLQLPTNQEASFYVATLKEMPADLHQPQFTLPQLLRGMPKSRLRIPYIKALQLLADGFKQDVKAVEVSELLN